MPFSSVYRNGQYNVAQVRKNNVVSFYRTLQVYNNLNTKLGTHSTNMYKSCIVIVDWYMGFHQLKKH